MQLPTLTYRKIKKKYGVNMWKHFENVKKLTKVVFIYRNIMSFHDEQTWI